LTCEFVPGAFLDLSAKLQQSSVNSLRARKFGTLGFGVVGDFDVAAKQVVMLLASTLTNNKDCAKSFARSWVA
jgi:hypothetical protein